MATIKIGNTNSVFQPVKANTSYVLEQGKLIDSGTSGIYQSAALDSMSFEIGGRIESVEAGIRIGDDMSPAPDLDIHITGTGRIESESRALYLHGSSQRVINEGRLFGTEGVRSVGVDGVIVNSGLIDASSVGIVTGGPHRVTNTGTITGGQYGIVLNATEDGGGMVKNTGALSGQFAAVSASSSDDRIINSGKIDGDVNLAGGDDTFVFKGGKVTGEVDGGMGSDIYVLRAAGLEIGESFGGGFDAVKASISVTLGSNVEQLNLIGKGNVDGTGNSQDNHVQGNAGRNVLRGEDGADFLVGFAGDDKLFGGVGGDVFNFQKGSGTDTVMDFEAGIDEIQVGGLKGAIDFADMLTNHLEQKGNDLWISYGGDVVILKDTATIELLSGDFVFG